MKVWSQQERKNRHCSFAILFHQIVNESKSRLSVYIIKLDLSKETFNHNISKYFLKDVNDISFYFCFTIIIILFFELI